MKNNALLIAKIMLQMIALVLGIAGEAIWAAVYDLVFRGHKNAHGNDHFLRPWDRLMQFLPTHQGLILGKSLRMSLKRSYQGMMVVAPVGMGKTTSLIVPNVLDCQGSFIVTDPSGEVFQSTAGHLVKRGFAIQVFNASEIDASCSFNPLSRITNEVEAKQISDILVEAASPESSGDQTFWNAGASMAINLLIRILLKCDPVYRTPYNLKHLLDSFGGVGDELDQLFLQHADDRLFIEYKGFISQSDKVRQSMVSTAKTALEKFSDPDLCKLCSGQGQSLDFSKLRSEKTAIYLINREDKTAYFSFLYRLLYTEVFESLMQMPKKEDKPLFLFMDEFANIGKIQNFSSYATTIRKRRVALTIVLQELSQLESTYGKSAADTILFGGMASKVFFPGLGLETTRRISDMLGQAPAHYKVEGRWAVKERPLMTPSEVRTMHDHEALYLYANKRPLKFRLLPFYKSRRMRKQTEIPAPIIQSQLSAIELHYLPIPQKPQSRSGQDFPDIEL